MPHPEYEAMIDAYLLGRLSEEETERFERHYFECPECFRETADRAAMIEAVKAAGPAPVRTREANMPLPSGFRPFSLAWVTIGAVLVLLAVSLLFIPRASRPPDFPDGGIRSVRGETLTLTGPVGTIKETPKELVWVPVEGATEYTVVLEGIKPVWTAATRETSIKIPPEIAARMSPGKIYTWRVKAYAAGGALAAASARKSFLIAR